MHALGGDELEHKIPVERCFDWEILALVELALGRPRGGRGLHAPVRGATPSGSASSCRARWPSARARRCSWPRASPTGRREKAARAAELAAGIGARAGRPPSRPGCRARRWPRPAGATRRSRSLRAAEAELDGCGSVRVRDEVRRELRKLRRAGGGAGPAAAGDSGVAALTKRELEIAELVTDRQDEPRDRRRRSSSATRRSSRTCATSSSSSASPRASRWRARSSASARGRRSREHARGAPGRGRRAPARAGLPPGARAPPALPRQRRDRLRRDLARRRALRGRDRGHGGRRPRLGLGAPDRARRAVPAASRSTPSWRPSSRSPAAPTSGRGG